MLGYSIYEGKLEDIIVSRYKVINTINPHSYCTALNDEEFKQALRSSDLLLPDGIGIVWATKVLKHKQINKIAGYDIFIQIMKQLENNHGSCFFLGSSNQTLELISKRVGKEYPNIKVGAYSPPFKPKFSIDESKVMCEKVNRFDPTVLFVGMTAPKQEKWVAINRHNLKAEAICSIGAVFDFYAGTVKRPSKFWIDYGLEWLPRFLNEPKRLAKRNLVSTPLFVMSVLKHRLFNR